ncbi:MAG: exosortase/archaeosortase family protein [Bacteroidales bacterium]|jgi:exosortase/archaeosortase family protein|nr:exosortase/archaeosortase family protein [Bacteroidales bacterium]
MNKVYKKLKFFYQDPGYRQVRGVLWFVVITLGIHYSYRFWAQNFHYWPIQLWMNDMTRAMATLVFDQSVWVNRHLLNISMTFTGQCMWFDNGSGISINSSCSGDKQIIQFALLMLLYPGPWKHKLWFIPMGMIIVHLTNILRIVLLSVISNFEPQWMKIAHDTVLRAMFYVVIFALWVWWVERVGKSDRREVIGEKR